MKPDPNAIKINRVEELLRAAGINTPPDKAFDEIQNIASEYRSSLAVPREPLKNRRQRLNRIRETCNALTELLVGLDKPTADRLKVIYRSEFLGSNATTAHEPKLPTLSRDMESIMESNKRLGTAITIALESLPKGGPPRKETRNDLFVASAELYESLCDRRFAYSDKREQFRGSDFVRNVVLMIEPKLTDRDVKNGLKRADSDLIIKREFGTSKKLG